MESKAKAYSALNKPQYDLGVDFMRTLRTSKGDKVLDMGCGTGELTKFIADIVGADGEVVGVDPDEVRIKVAQEKFKDVQNVKFFVGNSVTGFPHDNDQYYDLHFSNTVFHWVRAEEKKVYLRKAYQCLKPGGRIAILCGVKPADIKISKKYADVVDLLTEKQHEELFESVGLFTDVVVKKANGVARFASFDEFKAWFAASSQGDVKLEDLEPEIKTDLLTKYVKEQADGTCIMETRDMISITGRKKA